MHECASEAINLDHLAGSHLRPEARDAAWQWLNLSGGNPSSIHQRGRRAEAALSRARRQVAKAFGARPADVIFVGSGSEANHLAILSSIAAASRRGERARIVTTAIEHESVSAVAESWMGRDVDWTVLPVALNGEGLLEACEKALEQETSLLSVMMVNHETGQRLPIEALSALARAKGVPVHCDAAAAVGRLSVRQDTLGVDFLSFSGHKFGSLPGVGVLIVRKGKRIEPMMVGGPQERRRRAGAENLPGIIALGAAAENMSPEQESIHLQGLIDELLKRILDTVPDVSVITPKEACPGILNLSFSGVEGQSLLMNLDLAGICVSSGAPCSSGSLDPSPVLLAQGLSEAQARSSIRLSLGWSSTRSDVETAAEVLADVVHRLRSLSSRRGA